LSDTAAPVNRDYVPVVVTAAGFTLFPFRNRSYFEKSA